MPDAERNAGMLAEDGLRGAAKIRRRSVRRAVQLDCVLECDSWDGSVVLPATDVSDEGLWVETPYALQPGEELVISFGLPGSDENTRVWAIAEVARVGMWRRRQDVYPAGMGLVFTYCSELDRMRLRAALAGRPPRLPAGERDASAPGEQVETHADPPLPAVLDWLLASE